MTILLKPLVYQIHEHLMACYKACTWIPAFLAQSWLLKLIIIT